MATLRYGMGFGIAKFRTFNPTLKLLIDPIQLIAYTHKRSWYLMAGGSIGYTATGYNLGAVPEPINTNLAAMQYKWVGWSPAANVSFGFSLHDRTTIDVNLEVSFPQYLRWVPEQLDTESTRLSTRPNPIQMMVSIGFTDDLTH